VVWRTVVAYLHEIGELHVVDAGTIETYCLAVVRQRRLAAELAAGPLVGADGKLSPVLRVLEGTAATVKNCALALKLSPTARKGAKPPAKTATSHWAGVLPR
jgi:phage terminase small subunit